MTNTVVKPSLYVLSDIYRDGVTGKCKTFFLRLTLGIYKC